MHDVSPLIRRVVARNPSKFTYYGTGTYIVGRGQVAVIDPGPNQQSHVSAILQGLGDETISHIVVTHTHSDHSPASVPLKSLSGADIYGFQTEYRRNELPETEPVEEDVDQSFTPDVPVTHGDLLHGEGWTLECVHTPGHMSNHICYRLLEERALFTGDHVMGWSTSVIIPPDGSMSDYMGSLQMLLEADDRTYYPTHGPSIDDPKPFVRAYIRHREQREAEVIECFRRGFVKINDMVPVVYEDVDPALHNAAARSMFATVIKLWEEGKVECEGEPQLFGKYRFSG